MLLLQPVVLCSLCLTVVPYLLLYQSFHSVQPTGRSEGRTCFMTSDCGANMDCSGLYGNQTCECGTGYVPRRDGTCGLWHFVLFPFSLLGVHCPVRRTHTYTHTHNTQTHTHTHTHEMYHIMHSGTSLNNVSKIRNTLHTMVAVFLK